MRPLLYASLLSTLVLPAALHAEPQQPTSELRTDLSSYPPEKFCERTLISAFSSPVKDQLMQDCLSRTKRLATMPVLEGGMPSYTVEVNCSIMAGDLADDKAVFKEVQTACTKHEQQAYGFIRSVWTKLPGKVITFCRMQANYRPDHGSYVAFEQCLYDYTPVVADARTPEFQPAAAPPKPAPAPLAGFPTYDVDAACRAKFTNASNAEYHSRAINTCLEPEQDAYDFLKVFWPQTAPAVQQACLAGPTFNGRPYIGYGQYQRVASCLITHRNFGATRKFAN